MGLFGPPNVEKMKDRRDIEGLIKALGYYRKPEIRIPAARALGDIGDVRAVDPLIAALKDEYLGRDAAGALGKIGDARAVEPIIASLSAECWKMRQAAAVALGSIGDARAVEPLIATLKDKNGHVRKAAAQALEHLGWQPEGGEAAVWYWIANEDWVEAQALGSLAVEPLIATLDDKKRDVRRDAARALGEIGDPRAVEPLIVALKDTHMLVRETAAEALGNVKDTRAMDPLIIELKDKDADVRKAVAKVLRKLGWQPEGGEAAVWYWIANEDWAEAQALGSLAVEPLITTLEDKKWDVRRDAARALGEIGDPRAVKPLIAAANDDDDDVREASASALGKIGDARAVKTLIAALKDEGWGQDDVRGRMPTVEVRLAAAQALGRIGDPRAVKPLIAMLKDADYDVRKAAAGALVRLHHQGEVDEQSKKRILGVRKAITEEHVDTRGYCYSDHTDHGIGADFPL